MNEITPYEKTEEVAKSNALIASIGKQSLLGNKIMLVALTKVEDRKSVPKLDEARYKEYLDTLGLDVRKGLISEFHLSELNEINGKKNRAGKFYVAVRELFDPDSHRPLKEMFNIMIKDEKQKLYASVGLIECTIYDEKKKKLIIKFVDQPIVRESILELRNNYTLLPKDKMLATKSNYTFKLYELLKSAFDKENALRVKRHQPVSPTLTFTYSLAELKFNLGLLSPSDAIAKEALKTKNPDFEAIEGHLTSKPMRYSDFKKYALTPAQKELSEKMGMNIEFDPVRSGRGGKIVGISISVTMRDQILENKTDPGFHLTEDQKFDFYDEIKELLQVKTKDAKSIAESAGYDLEKVKKAVAVMKKKKNITNVTGFIISAIQGNYETVPMTNNKSAFHNFQQHNHPDGYYDDLLDKIKAN